MHYHAAKQTPTRRVDLAGPYVTAAVAWMELHRTAVEQYRDAVADRPLTGRATGAFFVITNVLATRTQPGRFTIEDPLTPNRVTYEVTECHAPGHM